MHHPWRDFRTLIEWTLIWADLPDMMGQTCWSTRTITLDRQLTQAERRCTIAHEIEHARRGPVLNEPNLAAKEEHAIDASVARRLIGIEDLGEALAWAHSHAEAAEDLWVDLPTLQARLRYLHPSERHYLRRRLQHRNGAGGEQHDDDVHHDAAR